MRRPTPGAPKSTPSAFLRYLPALLLPSLVFLLQPDHFASLPLVLLAFVVGVALSVFVPRASVALPIAGVWFTIILAGSTFLAHVEADFDHGKGRSAGNQPSAGAPAAAASPRELPSVRLRGLLNDANSFLHGGYGSGNVRLENLSVVLPCAFEGGFAEQTVRAILQHTRHSRLHEIIVVDDGSQPPLSTKFPAELLNSVPGQPLVRIIRHPKTVGLIGAKKTGGDAAVGDVIVFFDCHVSPNEGWEEAFLRQMKRAGDHRTVVVPTISTLDPDTWKEVPGGVGQACYLLLNGDFTWLSHPGRDVPLMSGGLLAISRLWWEETEGYDEHMVAWGGENIDQTLRTWLCGGRIEVADGARVAHMWRDPHKPKTMLHYPIPTRDVMRNKARAITAWFGEFRNKTFTFPEYEQFTNGESSIGDMSNFDRLKRRLQCAPFSSYLNRFSYVYRDGGLLADEVFQIREVKTGLCLERVPNERPPHSVELAPCAGGANPLELPLGREGITEKQLWHRGNRDRSTDACCSGIMNWNFLQCLDATGSGAQLKTYECAIRGESQNQFFSIGRPAKHADDGEQLLWRGTSCVGPMELKTADAGKSPAASCGAHVEGIGGATVEVGGQVLSANFKIVAPAKDGKPKSCAAPVQNAKAGDGSFDGWTLQFVACAPNDPQQVFHSSERLGGLEVRAGDSGMCLDAAGGSKLLVYPCYPETTQNFNQVWYIENNQLLWHGDKSGYCVDDKAAGAELAHYAMTGQNKLETCAVKSGQHFARYAAEGDGSFKLRDVDSPDGDECICAQGPLLRLCGCAKADRWQLRPATQQVVHVSTNQCLTSQMNQARLGACTNYGNTKFRFLEPPGWLQAIGSWGDNGRIRRFETCVDFRPVERTKLSVQACERVHQKGVRWERFGARTPPETRLWQASPKDPAGQVLGGSAQKPP